MEFSVEDEEDEDVPLGVAEVVVGDQNLALLKAAVVPGVVVLELLLLPR